MKLDNLTRKFIDQPANLEMGAGKLATRFKCTTEDIYKAKAQARKVLGAVEIAELSNIISEQEEHLARYVGSESSTGGSIKNFESVKPLSPKEIEQLAGVDGIGTRIARVWDKLLPNGKWTYAIDVRYDKGEFYSKEELKEKLKEIFPNVKPVSLPPVKKISEKALVILVSDDHAGALTDNSMYGNVYSGSVYQKRLMKISEEVKRLGETFEEVHLLSLGDQMNGWNSQTTRGGHEVKSVSNKEQFDIYTSARVAFYNDLFSSGISKKYLIHDVENSNHTGNDFSYMANRFLGMYLEARFPTVVRQSYFLPVECFDYGIHTIGFTHGKDEKLMTRPLPLKLDPKTDLFLFQYFDKKGKSPKERRITMYKGDLHTYAMDKGKFGRYVNIPSIIGSTDWTEVNFGDTEPGALIEIFEKNNKSIKHIPVWF